MPAHQTSLDLNIDSMGHADCGKNSLPICYQSSSTVGAVPILGVLIFEQTFEPDVQLGRKTKLGIGGFG